MSASVSGCWSVGASQPRLRKASGLRGWCMLWTIVIGDVYKILQKGWESDFIDAVSPLNELQGCDWCRWLTNQPCQETLRVHRTFMPVESTAWRFLSSSHLNQHRGQASNLIYHVSRRLKVPNCPSKQVCDTCPAELQAIFALFPATRVGYNYWTCRGTRPPGARQFSSTRRNLPWLHVGAREGSPGASTESLPFAAWQNRGRISARCKRWQKQRFFRWLQNQSSRWHWRTPYTRAYYPVWEWEVLR